MADSMSDEEQAEVEAGPSKGLKKRKVDGEKPTTPGIIYLSTIPPKQDKQALMDAFSIYGKILNIRLRRDRPKKGRVQKHRKPLEGWIEFADKRVAKRVAATLNNAPVSTKRTSPAYSYTWNLKYLHQFKWVHLHEQLQYERAVHLQRMRTEIMHAKRVANNFIDKIEKGNHLKQLEEKVLKKSGLWADYNRQITQTKPIQKKPNKKDGDEKIFNMIFT